MDPMDSIRSFNVDLVVTLELRRRKRLLRVARRRMRDLNDPFDIADSDFMRLYRIPKEGVRYIVEEIAKHLPPTHRCTAVPPHIHVLCALKFFANGTFQRRLGEDDSHSLSQSSVSKSIRIVSDAMQTHLLDTWVKFPFSQSEKQQVKQRFADETGFPGTLGALTVTHIRILSSHMRGHMYLNSNSYYSKIVQIVSDYDLKIRALNACFGGATDASYVWKNSLLYHHMKQSFEGSDQSSWLLGDSGYCPRPWLITPFNNPSPSIPEKRFNESHSKAWSRVRKCVGLWKSWFKCLRKDKSLCYTPERTGFIINTCAILHNMALHYRVPQSEEWLRDEFDEVEEIGSDPSEGFEVQRKIITQHFT